MDVTIQGQGVGRRYEARRYEEVTPLHRRMLRMLGMLGTDVARAFAIRCDLDHVEVLCRIEGTDYHVAFHLARKG